MPINSGDEEIIGVQTGQAQPQPQPQPQYTGPVETPRADVRGTTQASGPEVLPWYASHSNNSPMGALIGMSIGGEILNILVEKFSKFYKSAPKNIEFSLLAQDRQQNSGLHFSCLVICATDKQLGATAYHTLVLEATNEPISSVMQPLPNGAGVEITRLPSDAADAALAIRVENLLKASFPKSRLLTADSTIVPRSFDMSSDQAIYNLAYNAALACGSELNLARPSFEDIQIGKLMAATQGRRSLSIATYFGRSAKFDAVGNPSRADFRCVCKDTPPNRTNNLAVNTQEQSTYLSEVTGFIDVVYVGGNEINPYAPQQQVKRDSYASRLVITDIDKLAGYTVGSMLLAISTLSVLSGNGAWMAAFKPKSIAQKGTVDYSDVGALGYENDFFGQPELANKKIDFTNSAGNMNPDALLGQFLSILFKPGIMISFDIPDAGPQTWYSRIFAAASRGRPAAAQSIIEAAVALTNGQFDRNFNVNNIFLDRGNRIHLGYYMNRNNEMRDIRDLDYLAVANQYGEMDRQRIVDWSETFTRQDLPLELRMAERKKMIMSFFNNQVTFTGYAERVTFSGMFLDALINAIKACGMHVNLVSTGTAGDFNAARAGASYAPAAIFNGQGYATPSIVNTTSSMMGMGGVYGDQVRW